MEQIVISATRQSFFVATGLSQTIAQLCDEVLSDLRKQAAEHTTTKSMYYDDGTTTYKVFGTPRILGAPQVLHVDGVVSVSAFAEVLPGTRHEVVRFEPAYE